MMQGIRTDTQIDPVTAAAHFSTGVQSLDLKYEHYQGLGYVIDGDDDVIIGGTLQDFGHAEIKQIVKKCNIISSN